MAQRTQKQKTMDPAGSIEPVGARSQAREEVRSLVTENDFNDAAAQGDFVKVRELLRHPRAKPALEAAATNTVFVQALVNHGDAGLLGEAFDAGLSPRAFADGVNSSALMVAIKNGVASVIPLLMERCDARVVNECGETAFSAACAASPPDLQLIEALIPATIQPTVGSVDPMLGTPPPLSALAYGCANIAVAKKLIAAGSLFARDEDMGSAFSWLCFVRAQRPEIGAYFRFVINEMLREDHLGTMVAAAREIDGVLRHEKSLLETQNNAPAGKAPPGIAVGMGALDELAGMGLVDAERQKKMLAFAGLFGEKLPITKALRERSALNQAVAEAGAEKPGRASAGRVSLNARAAQERSSQGSVSRLAAVGKSRL